MGGSGVKVVHTDLAAELNPTEEQWNAIVQQNLKNFEEEKKRVKAERYQRTKKIQEEQKVQMALKAEKFKSDLEEQQRHFKDVGIYTSDKFYVNEDAMKRKMNSIKGNAKVMSQTMHEKYLSLQEQNREKMKREAEERIKLNQDLAEED